MNIKDLDRLDLGHSPLSDNIYLGVLNKAKNIWKYKRDVTNGFLQCVIQRWENQTEIIKSGSDEWEVTVRKIATNSSDSLPLSEQSKLKPIIPTEKQIEDFKKELGINDKHIDI